MPTIPALGKFAASQRTGEFAGTSHSRLLSTCTKKPASASFQISLFNFNPMTNFRALPTIVHPIAKHGILIGTKLLLNKTI